MKVFDTKESLVNTLWKEDIGTPLPKIDVLEYALALDERDFSKNKKGSPFTARQMQIANRLLMRSKGCEKTGHEPEEGESYVYFSDSGLPQAYSFCKRCHTSYSRNLTPEETEAFENIAFNVN